MSNADVQERGQESPLGLVIYEGPSAVDGAEIAVIVNKLEADSANAKTGGLVQSFILRSDVPPYDALVSGDDYSVCGHCRHRPKLAKETGDPPCYVNVLWSVRAVFDAYQRDRYVRATPKQAGRLLKGKRIRLGTYGDPGAAPLKVWTDLVSCSGGHTGYSHLWNHFTYAHGMTRKAWQRLVMASVDTEEEYRLAKSLGWRTFRVATDWLVQPNEIRCPASKEAGNKTTCAKCMLCGGTTTKTDKDIVIIDHARGHATRVIPLVAAPAA
jgi:hypothetical protein